MTRTLETAVLDSPAGPLAVVTVDGVVVASGFGTLENTVARLEPRLRTLAVRERSDLGAVSRIVAAYARGDVDALRDAPVSQPGGELMQRLWSELRAVRPPSTVSYSALAALAERPTAVRVAGNACARNLVAPFVPCHRVVRADGSLGNYYFGVDVKRALLVHEGWTSDEGAGEGAAVTRNRS